MKPDTIDVPITQISVDEFARRIGRHRATIHRWRDKGMLDGIVDICGRKYIEPDGIRRFNERVRQGEFARPLAGAAKRSSEAKNAA